MENTQHIEGESPGQRRHGRQDARPLDRGESRHVIRDKSPLHTPGLGTKGPASFDPVETERRETTSWGRRGYGIVFHPQPYLVGTPDMAHVDWVSVTFRPPAEFGWSDIFEAVRRATGFRVTERKKSGWNAYEFCALLGDFGFVAWGGKHQRGTVHLEINGTGCMLVDSWRPLIALCETFEGRITRVDLAHDDFFGEGCNIDQLLAWYQAGGFNCGGRNPKIRRAGDWDNLEGGRTLYIGTRGNKLLRGYEKGKQLGRKDSTWFRVELEWRGKNRVIPWAVLEQPGDYLAGAFPCLAFLSERQEKIRTLQCGAEISVETMTREARRLSGKAVNVLMDMCKGDAAAVVKLLQREGVPKRLRPWAEGIKHLGKPHENP